MYVCVQAKQTWIPFQTSSNKSSTIFHRIDCGIWSEYPTLSTSSAHYILASTDDNSSNTRVQPHMLRIALTHLHLFFF